MAVYGDMSITPQELLYLNSGELAKFWLSRLNKKDPIARIGYALWSPTVDDLKRVVSAGDAQYWGNKPYQYWEVMARTTVVNLAVGLQTGGFEGTFGEMREEIKRVGVEVAKQHAIFVTRDIKDAHGHVDGLLSLRQVADYHHKAFAKFNIPADFYGGTWLERVPDEAEFKLYGSLYCHDCDTDTGY
jgi:hypothetical protein